MRGTRLLYLRPTRGLRFLTRGLSKNPLFSTPSLPATKDRSKYLRLIEGLQFIHSPQALMDRAEICVDLCQELAEQVQKNRNDPVRCLAFLDTMSNLLCLILDPAEAIRNTHPDPAFRQASTDAFHYVFRYMSELNSKRELYEPMVLLMEPKHWDTLTPLQKRNAMQMKLDMDASGIMLPKEQRDMVVSLTSRKEELAHELVTAPTVTDQEMVLKELLETRFQLSRVLGHESYAEWTMGRTMAMKPQNAWAFINRMSAMLMPTVMEEVKGLLEVRRKVSNTSSGVMTPTEKARLTTIYKMWNSRDVTKDFSEYLSAANVWRGLQMVCRDVFGVVFEHEEASPPELYHPTVQKYTLYDSTSRKKLGTIYADLLNRPDKMPSPGHFTLQLGTTLHRPEVDALGLEPPPDYNQLPIVIITCNANASSYGWGSSDWERVLLSPSEVKTLFHEFGHALHTIFGHTEQQNLAGTRSSIDYVETFSQFLEFYSTDHRVLQHFAKHYVTGQPIPKELVTQYWKSQHSVGALETLDHLVFAAADLTFHGEKPMGYFTGDDGDLRRVTLPPNTSPSGVLCELARVYMPFISADPSETWLPVQHMGNYPAAYYSYAYTKVIASAIWVKHFEKDPFNAEAGRKLRDLMALGASGLPQDLFATFFGSPPRPEKLLSEIPFEYLVG